MQKLNHLKAIKRLRLGKDNGKVIFDQGFLIDIDVELKNKLKFYIKIALYEEIKREKNYNNYDYISCHINRMFK